MNYFNSLISMVRNFPLNLTQGKNRQGSKVTAKPLQQKKILACTLLLVISVMAFLASCESIAVDEPTYLLSDTSVFQDETTAESAVVGIYSQIMSGTAFASGGRQSVTYLSGLSADTFTNYSFLADENQFYTNALNATNNTLEQSIWNQGYNHIYTANSILEGLAKATEISVDTKQRLEGEAKFIRAFFNFYLVNLFGDIPLVTSTDYLINSTISRSPVADIYEQIIADLEDAEKYLPSDYSFYSGMRTRPTRFAASALLARTFLYTEQWSMAEQEASKLIGAADLFTLESDLDNVFLATSKEAIWQLASIDGTRDTWEGYNFILTNTPPIAVTLADGFLQNFGPNDSRLLQWTGHITDGTQSYGFPFKYKIRAGGTGSEFSMVLRLAEQYLIRAEARAMLGDLPNALADLNTIRTRTGVANIQASEIPEFIDLLMEERHLELFAEWGHRWLDLKRTGRANTVLSSLKPDWQETDVLYPIPQQEIQTNPNLSQNPGY